VTLPVIFHELAEGELNEAAAYYAHARPGLGDAFVVEVQHAVDRLAASPLAGKAVENDVRWWLVKRFPYSVLYRVPGARRSHSHTRDCTPETTTPLLAWAPVKACGTQRAAGADGPGSLAPLAGRPAARRPIVRQSGNPLPSLRWPNEGYILKPSL
jgi:toxin ParE1/3/4